MTRSAVSEATVRPGLSRSPASGTSSASRPLAALLEERLHGTGATVIMTAEHTLPGPGLWTAAQALAADLRASGLSRGDRVLVCTHDDLLLAAIVVAGLSSDLTVALLRPAAPGPLAAAEIAAHADAVGARLVLCAADEIPTAPAVLSTPAPCVVAASLGGLTAAGSISPRPRRHPAQPDVALLARTPGSGPIPPVWVALTQANLTAALTSHLPALLGDTWDTDDSGSRPAGVMASVLPWTDASGVVLDLLAGLLSAQLILRSPAAAADPARLAELLDQAGPGAWLNAAPEALLGLQRRDPAARDHLAGVHGGFVTGASYDAGLYALLEGTRLLVGSGFGEVEVIDGRLCLTGPSLSAGVLGPQGDLLRTGAATSS